jgi:hypothetical protein
MTEQDNAMTAALESLGQDLHGLRWSEAAAVRSCARRIRGRAVALTSLAVVLVLGAGTATAWYAFGRPSAAPVPVGTVTAPPVPPTPEPTIEPTHTPTPTPSPSPSVDLVPLAAMLQPADLGDGWRVETEQLKGDLGLGLIGRVCWNELSTPSSAHVIGGRSRGLTNRPDGVPAAENDPYSYVSVEATRYEPGWATVDLAEWLADTHKPCSYDNQTHTLTVIDSGFAGDQSILMRYAQSTGFQEYFAFVRRGDIVVLVRVTPDDLDLLHQASGATAQRLCAIYRC